ncbi:hypothetical protein KIN20_030115 [Parelaphostrongylus tenuis]|uniref:Core Histone H2A/H2B/H3 domain-containing protein n=1 Tax=Parelaphostrongylus tenuis TaxID=148309 RepID=A0AAD5R387_PARTN|nr:hypothetical protein KIN20_030115 [Parelaphostrongylus tenuis]
MAAIKKITQMSTAGKVHRKQPFPEVPRNFAPVTSGVKKPHRYRPRADALCKIRRHRNSNESPTHKLPFQRLVCKIARAFKIGIQLESSAVIAVQEASESYLFALFEDANHECSRNS